MSNQNTNQGHLLKIILAPHISEKSTYLGEKNNQTIFRVARDATKLEIKRAVELLWKEQKIEVKKVQTINVKGKQKRFGRFVGKRSDWKKAIVSIKNEQELNFTNFANIEAK
ncbi:50S ribosomal protein L23 [Nitrosomonas ureae]|uniref:Large ribosomal subunit protein uL23 n=1 Tax=Nitrosomonas ureae TaxID=44577 RepID=A0A0S3AJE4_9PROT|nr:50S ribosomal protein L23 [Nitrosomonas ureae]ALQ51263.1 50S ribosomal protein L23 [Nitrosomonas ureae]PTQ83856.1 LSU ribosomal protein L23P [Nitrosomonas ureae]SDU24749.1 LSU ribosomal protein L23P [Nitrosomonas ureae]SEQ14657.1 large subunit ribosomal protein L23 [Nitrosomonas ureae]SOD21231.1 LSU ribosomal protein L23P [Nitrosomonas ureae]